jgi:hypothetical protein
MSSDKKLWTLNVAQTVMAIIVSLGTVLGVFAAYVTLPQKVKDMQDNQTRVWEHLKTTDDKRESDHEILVRVEEDLKNSSETLTEIKSDIKVIHQAQQDQANGRK